VKNNELLRIEERLDRIDVTLARNTESLEYHIKRTDELQDLTKMTARHVVVVQGIFKAVMGLAAVVTAVGAIIAAV
jgi:hypothetical protein